MSSSSFQAKLIFEDLVDQNPVRLNMAVSVPRPFTRQLMITILWRQWLLLKKQIDYLFEL